MTSSSAMPPTARSFPATKERLHRRRCRAPMPWGATPATTPMSSMTPGISSATKAISLSAMPAATIPFDQLDFRSASSIGSQVQGGSILEILILIGNGITGIGQRSSRTRSSASALASSCAASAATIPTFVDDVADFVDESVRREQRHGYRLRLRSATPSASNLDHLILTGIRSERHRQRRLNNRSPAMATRTGSMAPAAPTPWSASPATIPTSSTTSTTSSTRHLPAAAAPTRSPRRSTLRSAGVSRPSS